MFRGSALLLNGLNRSGRAHPPPSGAPLVAARRFAALVVSHSFVRAGEVLRGQQARVPASTTHQNLQHFTRGYRRMADPKEICITNAGIYVKERQLLKALRDGGLDITKIAALHKDNTKTPAFLAFDTEEDAKEAIEKICTISHKGKVFSAKQSTSATGIPFNKRTTRPTLDDPPRGGAGDADGADGGAGGPRPNKRPRRDSIGSEGSLGGAGGGGGKSLADVVTPWHSVSYDAQLQAKQQRMQAVLQAIVPRLASHILRNVTLPKAFMRDVKALEASLNAALNDEKPPTPFSAAAASVAVADVTSAPAADAAAPASESVSSSSSASGVSGAAAAAGEAAVAASAALAAPTAAPTAAPAKTNGSRGIEVPDTLSSLLPPWVLDTLRKGNGACPLLAIHPSPLQSGYRNKASFTVGETFDAEGKAIAAAGHRLGSFKDSIAIGVPDETTLLYSPQLISLLQHINSQFFASSPLRPWDLDAKQGVWRTLTLREAQTTGQLMAVIMTNNPPAPAEDAEAAVKERYELYQSELRRFVQVCRSWSCPIPYSTSSSSSSGSVLPSVVSVQLQEYDGIGQAPPQNHPHKLLPLPDNDITSSSSGSSSGNSATITEHLCRLKFQISPGAFFQVNTPGADVLYTLVRESAVKGVEGMVSLSSASSASIGGGPKPRGIYGPINPRTTALADICCGTGTIGLACASSFARIVGVELSSEAIDDARINAALNDIPSSRAVFLCEKAEAVMAQVLEKASAPATSLAPADSSSSSGSSADAGAGASEGAAAAPADPIKSIVAAAAPADPIKSIVAAAAPADPIKSIVAVVDPPRGGLHPSVIKAMRTCKHLKRVIYVSCNPTGTFIEDAMKLCAPHENSSAFARGPAFKPTAATPVDLFPHTPHTELVCIFERE